MQGLISFLLNFKDLRSEVLFKDKNTEDEFVRYPGCGFPLLDTECFVDKFRERLHRRIPTSLIRLGDGEGVFLSRPQPINKYLWPWVLRRFGPCISSNHVLFIADQLSNAIIASDFVGIRDDLINVDFHSDNFDLTESDFIEKFCSSFHLRDVEKNLPYSHAIRIALLHQNLCGLPFRKKTVFVSAWIHFKLSANGVLVRSIKNSSHIGIVTSRDAIAEMIRSELGTEVDFYKIPDVYFREKYKEKHNFDYIQSFNETIRSLRVRHQGQLFLVGGGILGKIYCHRIKKLGGIAIDIGAVCDAWVDFPTRNLVFKSIFNQHDGKVPMPLLLKNQAKQAKNNS